MSDAKEKCETCGTELRASGVCPRCVFETALGDYDILAEEPTLEALGDYELIEEIARGGAGVVWRARQRRLNRTVALKLLRERALPGESAARRFRIEAEAAAQLRHPHIVCVYEVGEAAGRWFLSMELLAGTLAGRGPMPPRTAAQILVKIARAVQHAHDRGILHRDLKPANVLLDEAGEPRVGDFGLARLEEKASTLTESGVVIGTPAYMSPEQASGSELTTASDIYSLGAIFYELLGGEPPFVGATMVEVIRKVCDEEPARLERRLDSPAAKPGDKSASPPRDLEVIAFKCLEKKPASRYPSALALAEEIERWLRGEPILARPTTATERLWKWARRRPALAALWATAALALIVILVGGAIFNRHLDAQRKKAEQAAEATLHQLARQHAQSALHFTETGDWQRGLLSLAEAVELGSGAPATDEINRLRFESILRLGPRLDRLWFPAPGEKFRTQFSADGKHLLLTATYTARLSDGPTMDHTAKIVAVDINPDGTRVLCGTSDGRWTLWDARSAKIIASGEGRLIAIPEQPFCRFIGNFGGGRFVVIRDEKIICQFRANDGQPAMADVPLDRPILWAVPSPDAEKIFALTDDGNLRAIAGDDPAQISPPFPMKAGAQLQSFVIPLKTGRYCTFYLGDNVLTILGWNGDRRSSALDEKVLGFFRTPDDVLAVGWLENRNCYYIAAAGDGATLRTPWHPNTKTYLPSGTRAASADFDEIGYTAITLAVNGAGQRWDLVAERPTGPRVWSIGKPLETRMNAAGSVATVTTSEAVWVWHYPSHDGAHQAIDAGSSPLSVTFSADSANVCVSLGNGTRREWIAQTGKENAPAAPIAASEGKLPTNPTLTATMGADQTVRIADMTHRIVAPPLVHPAPVVRARFSPDERLLCTMWGGQFARLWDTRTGEPVTPPFFHSGSEDAAWSPDGRWLATFGKGAEVRVWDFGRSHRALAEMKTLARLLSSHRLVPGSDYGLIGLSVDELREAWEQGSAAQRPE